MPLPLLHPHLDIVMLARNDDHPEEAADWLVQQYRHQPDAMSADVLLMWGQGFWLPELAVCVYCVGGKRFHEPTVDCRVCHGTARDSALWHLPQATLALWAECVYGAERRRAVERWLVYAPCGDANPSPIRFLAERDTPPPKHEYFGNEAAADRELRRRVARLFPEIRREVPLVDQGETYYCDGKGLDGWMVAEQFVPPEPVGVDPAAGRDRSVYANLLESGSHFLPPRPFLRDTGQLRRSINPGR